MQPLIQYWRSFVPSKKPSWFAALYVAFSCLWIVLTDKLLGHFPLGREAAIRWSIAKGFVYVVITGALIYTLLRWLKQINQSLEGVVASRTAALVASEEELRGRAEWLRRLLASLPDVAWTSSEDGRTIFISPNVEAVFGFSPEEICANGEEVWLGRIHPEHRGRVIGAYQALFSRGQPFDEEYRIQCKNGSWIWVHDRAVRTHKEGGVPYADGIFSDITARKQAEEAREQSDKRYRLLFETNLAGVFRAEADGKLLDCNPALIQMLGYDSANQLLGRPAAEILCDPAEETALLGRLHQSGAINNAEIRLRRRDGTVLWGLHNVCVESANGAPSCIAGTVVDITQQKQTAERLSQQLSLMQAITSAAPDGLFMQDAEGRVTFMNPAAERMFGYRTGELLGKVLHDVCHYKRRDGTPLPRADCVLSQASASGKALHSHEEVNFRKDGTPFEVSCSIAPVFEDGRILGSVLMVRDITRRKQAEDEHRSLQEQFLHAQKMEALGRLAFGVAHDFNNLLQIINGNAELIVDGSGADVQLAKRGRGIKEAGERAARLTLHLLDFSRHDADDPQITSLDRALKEMVKMTRTLVGEDVELTLRLDAPEAYVKINAGQLEQIVINLAVNARDAMPKGGKLHIETSCVNLNKNGSKALNNIPPGPYVRLSLSDNGCGMNAAITRHVFEPFFTTKERGKGTGLGLSTVYGIVTQNGGGIQLISEPGAGATFQLYFPLAEAKVSLQEIKERLALPKGKESVLLAEDEEEVRQLISGQLCELGYTVHEASNGVEALELVGHWRQPIELLISDMVMPKMGGQELSDRIRELCPAIKVLQMSGYTDILPRPGGGGRPGIRLQKPFTLAKLAETVRQVLDS